MTKPRPIKFNKLQRLVQSKLKQPTITKADTHIRISTITLLKAIHEGL